MFFLTDEGDFSDHKAGVDKGCRLSCSYHMILFMKFVKSFIDKLTVFCAE